MERAKLVGREAEAERALDLGCFFARGLGEATGVVVLSPEEMVRFLERLMMRLLRGDLGGGAWEVARRAEGKRREDEGEAGAGREGARRDIMEEGGGWVGVVETTEKTVVEFEWRGWGGTRVGGSEVSMIYHPSVFLPPAL